MGYRQAVRHQVLILALVGSNPATPANTHDPLAQLAEHLTFNQGVRSSNLRWVTTETPVISMITGVCYIWENTENAI